MASTVETPRDQTEQQQGAPPDLNRRGGPWRTEIAVRCEELHHRIAITRSHVATTADDTLAAELIAVPEAGVLDVRISGGHGDGAGQLVHVAAAERAVEIAQLAIERHGLWRSVHDWWTGSAVTAAWESVHLAEAELVEVAPEKDILALFPSVQGWMRDVMTPEKRAPYEKSLRAMQKGGADLDRAAVREIYTELIRANNDWHVKLRRFRNLLFGVSFVLGLVLVGLGVWHALHPETLSLCKGTGKSRVCLGGGKPHGYSVLEVEAIGALGGLLSVAYMLTKTKEPPSRYNLSVAQAVLKPVVGAATALVAVLLLLAGILGPQSILSTESMLAYAAVFGFSQELLTRWVDKNAAELLGEQADVSTKDAKGTNPAASDLDLVDKLAELRKTGALTEAEFSAAKAAILSRI
jgi:hypothetical protein